MRQKKNYNHKLTEHSFGLNKFIEALDKINIFQGNELKKFTNK